MIKVFGGCLLCCYVSWSLTCGLGFKTLELGVVGGCSCFVLILMICLCFFIGLVVLVGLFTGSVLMLFGLRCERVTGFCGRGLVVLLVTLFLFDRVMAW